MSGRTRSRVAWSVAVVSSAGWILLLAPSVGAGPASRCRGAHCAHAGHAVQGGNSAPTALAVAMTAWAVMLVAMMGPTLVDPINYVRERSFTVRRKRSIALFLVGYWSTWMAAGFVFTLALLGVTAWAPGRELVTLGVVGVACVWQCSPAKQRCLNRGHDHPDLVAFGAAADRSVLRFGVGHGAWCVASCWALMLIPASLGTWHVAAMVVVTVLMLGERLEGPRRPSWRVRGLAPLGRIVSARRPRRTPTLGIAG